MANRVRTVRTRRRVGVAGVLVGLLIGALVAEAPAPAKPVPAGSFYL
jgi:hypothetical protein